MCLCAYVCVCVCARARVCVSACACLMHNACVCSECGNKPADIVFLMDSSSSEGQSDFDKMKQFVSNFAEKFQVCPTFPFRLACSTYCFVGLKCQCCSYLVLGVCVCVCVRLCVCVCVCVCV